MNRPLPSTPPLRRPLGAGLLALALAAGCGGESTPRTAPRPVGESAPPAAGADGPVFAERAAETGLDFRHFNGMSGEFYYSEHMGGGAGLIDYDGDGDLDLYLTQGHMLGPSKTLADASLPPPEGPLVDRLYRNDLVVGDDGRRELRFTDVTAASGIEAAGYGMGVAVGDVDNDGWPDLYVTNWGSPNQLWRNNGDLTFSEIGAAAGVAESRWSIAVAFLDYDRDGWLDLFVSNYLDYTYSVHKECANDIGMRDYCGPASYRPVPDVLYRNRGDGTFEESGAALARGADPGGGMGVAVGDWDGNGWLDLYVANDELPNHLWMGQGDGTFRDEALMAGAAVNAAGDAEAGMGVGAGDVDGDGDEDLFIAHLDQETNTLYTNLGGGGFEDRTNEARLATPSWPFTGFGAGFLDYDNDGRLDIFVANGAVQAVRELLLAGDPHPLHQTNQLFRNLGGGRFDDVSAAAGPAFALSEVSRGAAFGDLDNDGDTDVVVHNNAGPVRLLDNRVGAARPWLGLRLVTGEPPRDALGAWAELVRPDGTRLGRRARSEGSYASAHDPRVLFGLGESAAVESVRVNWPGGTVERFPPPPVGRYTTLRQGGGEAAGGTR